FAAACQAGGVIAGAGADREAALWEYGDALGIAFQIVDDLLDIEGTEAIGKNRGDDLREGKLTLPVIRAIAGADAEERAFWARLIGQGQVEDGDVARARDLMEQRGALASTRAEAEAWVGRAKAALDRLPEHPLREMLADIADYVVAREA
ncbi:MAG TPA: polyprenyl synthetase family protein, partial [Rubellimicrobium sp.]|nr:polyprenyl synthetase family protein [Rubellimicrobium sp.]